MRTSNRSTGAAIETLTLDALPEQECVLCGRCFRLVAGYLQVCGSCLRSNPRQGLALAAAAHAAARAEFGRSADPPDSEDGVECSLCAHHCRLADGEMGYCAIRLAWRGRQVHLAGTPKHGLLHWYRDPLPTNCVAMPVCAGRNQPDAHNLAVFYAACTLNCLNCQNWEYRDLLPDEDEIQAALSGRPLGRRVNATELAAAAGPRTYCARFFGGDPAAQMAHALAAGQMLMERGVRVCWETNGTAYPTLMDRAVEQSLRSGGTVKFDLKACDDTLHHALTGASNRQTLANFARAAERVGERPETPLLVAGTLLVPGYVDPAEVRRIAEFIAALNPDIPYALLAFAPQFMLPDLPRTSQTHAAQALHAARDAGLSRVWIGNRFLLSADY